MVWWEWLACLAAAVLVAGTAVVAAPYFMLGLRRRRIGLNFVDGQAASKVVPPDAQPLLPVTIKSSTRARAVPARVYVDDASAVDPPPMSRPRHSRGPTSSLRTFL